MDVIILSKHYKPKEFAELLNVSVITLQRWDNNGKLKAFRTPTNRRYYTYEQYLESIKVFVKNKIREDEEVEKSLQDRN